MALRRHGRFNTRRGTASDLLIVGLANPGEDFESSRHNVGGDAVRLLAERLDVSLRAEKRQRGVSGLFRGADQLVTLAVPTTYMNDSGAALVPLVARASISDLQRLVIAHDELDLEPGRLQLKLGGGLAGHNGLRSIVSALGDDSFARLRIGIGKPASKEHGASHVLKPLTGSLKEQLHQTISDAADALELIVKLGFNEAQQRVNVRD